MQCLPEPDATLGPRQDESGPQQHQRRAEYHQKYQCPRFVIWFRQVLARQSGELSGHMSIVEG